MEGASEWVEGGLISFGPPQTPKSKKPRGVPRQPRKTSTPISEKGQGRTLSIQMSPPLTSPEGESHGEEETGLLGSEVMGPVIGDGMPQGSVPVPMTLMYTCILLISNHRYNLDLAWGVFIDQSVLGRPRFPTYTVGHPPMVSQQNPTGFNPQTPGGPPMGYPRGPPPRVSSKVFPGYGSKEGTGI